MQADENIQSFKYPRWIYLPIFLGPVLLYLPALIPGKTLFWGILSLQFIPWHWEALRSLVSGEMPLWNVWNGMGAPLAANYQSAIFYPPTWLTFLAGWAGGIEWMAWSHGVLVVLHLIWAGWGMKKLTESLGVGPIPQVISGVAYGLCGYLVARGSFLTMVQAASWIPWILFAASQFAIPMRKEIFHNKPNSIRSIIWLALAFSGQWLSGHAQLAWYTLLFCLAWLVVGAMINNGSKGLLRIILPVGYSGLLGFLLCSIQLLPTIEYFMQSQRSGAIDYQTALSYSFWPWRFLTLIFPGIFGNPGVGDYWGYGSFWEDAVYIGLLPLFLAIYFLIQSLKPAITAEAKPHLPFAWFSLTSIVIITLLALGWNTPVFPWLFDHVPTFGSFNGPTRLMVLVDVCLILLAGLGADAWLKRRVFQRKWINLGMTGVVALLLTTIFAFLFLPAAKESFKFAMLSGGVFAAGNFLLAMFKPNQIENSKNFHWRYLFIIWLSIDLLWAGFLLNPTVASANLFQDTASLEQIRSENEGRFYISTEDERDLRFKRFFLFDDIRPNSDIQLLSSSLLPNINILSQEAAINNFDPMVPDRFLDFMSEIDMASPIIRDKYLSLAGVTKRADVNPFDLLDIDWKPTIALPKARLLYCATFVTDGDQALRRLRKAAAEDKLSDLILIESDKFEQPPCINDISDEILINLSHKSTEKVYEINNNAVDGWLFITDSGYPGWNTSVDGFPTEIFRANYVFQAVRIPAGSHRVELKYQPISFLIGSCLTGLGIAFIIVLTIIVRKSSGGFR